MALDFWTWTTCRCLSFCNQNKGRVEDFFLISPWPCLSARCLCSSQVGGALSDTKKPTHFLLCAFPGNQGLRPWFSLWFSLTCCSSMNELEGNLGDWHRELGGDPLWPRYLAELKPYLPFTTGLGSLLGSHNIDDVLAEYQQRHISPTYPSNLPLSPPNLVAPFLAWTFSQFLL